MFFKRTLMPILFGILMIGATSAANAQVAEMSKGMALYQSAAQELVALYNGTKDAASAKAMAQKIDAAQKRKDTAEAAIQAALQKLDPKNENAGKLAEKIFGEMQRQNQAVAEAQLASSERLAAANAEAAMPKK